MFALGDISHHAQVQNRPGALVGPRGSSPLGHLDFADGEIYGKQRTVFMFSGHFRDFSDQVTLTGQKVLFSQVAFPTQVRNQ